jgi:transcriptional regulator with XRE-family HTH domain
MSRAKTDYERIEADPRARPALRREELLLEVQEAIAGAMEAQGVSRAELASRLGKTKGFVTQILSSERNLTLGTLAELADALGCAVQVRLERRSSAESARGRAAVRTPARRARRPASTPRPPRTPR